MNFLIFEIKNDKIMTNDRDQVEMYIQILRQKFPRSQSIIANLIGLRNPKIKSSENVKLISFNLEKLENGYNGIRFNLNE